jgi:hypothetical protein
MDGGDIVVSLITAGIPSAATVVVAFFQSRTMNKHAARQSILQLIMEDHLAVQEGKLPTNYQSVLHEYDIYKKNGGNSYVESKVSEYKIWFEEIQKQMKK